MTNKPITSYVCTYKAEVFEVFIFIFSITKLCILPIYIELFMGSHTVLLCYRLQILIAGRGCWPEPLCGKPTQVIVFLCHIGRIDEQHIYDTFVLGLTRIHKISSLKRDQMWPVM